MQKTTKGNPRKPRGKKQSADDSVFDTPARVIRDVDIVDEIETMFVPFAHYTIADRAIPSVYDGLKPSQRRILWAMQYSGYTSKKPYVKSSRIVGDVIGSWHPHGDASAYSTMANMVKPYILNVPLVEGKGSFGFIAGDTESAARYTEARMQPISDMFMEDVKLGAVDMKPNFDERLEEPVNLPVIFPVLPINGASGIAVGFATNCAPHNPDEIIDATIAYIKNPKMTIDDLLRIVPGPDFPTGCDIIGTDGIRSAYATGKGLIKQRAKYRIVPETRGRHAIEFYEIPYNISPEKVIGDINKLRADETVVGISDVMDLMDKQNPVRIVAYVKSGYDPTAIAELLISKSPSLYCTFGINQVAMVGRTPRQMSMLEMLSCFIEFRREVITRRTKTQIAKAEHDKQLQEALAAVLVDIDKVISIVRTSDTNMQVYTALKKTFNLNDEQAKYIGDMRLIQLKRKDKLEVDKKIKGYDRELKRLQNIIKTKANLNKEMIKELESAKALITRPRKSRIIGKTIEEYDASQKETAKASSTSKSTAKSGAKSNLVMTGNTNIYLMNNGTIYQTNDTKKKPKSYAQELIDIDVNDTILVIYDNGDSLRLPARELPSGKPSSMSHPIAGVANFGVEGKNISDMALITSGQKVKILDSSTLTKNPECSVMKLGTNEKILAARPVIGDGSSQSFVYVTNKANVLRFAVNTVNKQGRTSAGVAGIKLANGAGILYATIADTDTDILATSDGKAIKLSKLNAHPEKGRGTLGVNCHKLSKGCTTLETAYVGKELIAFVGENKIKLPEIVERDGKPSMMENIEEIELGNKA